MVLRLATAASLALLALPAAAQTKIAVVPFVALSGDIPAKTGAKAASMFANELKNVEGIHVVELPAEAKPDPADAALTEAKQAVAEAQGLEKKRKFGLAAGAYRRAIGRFESAAALLDGVGDLADARASLATVLYRTGDDAGGERELWLAVALAPERDFPNQATSSLFASLVRKARDKVLKTQRGSIRIDSVPVGCMAWLDGKAVGRTPVVVKDVPVGAHVWRLDFPTAEVVGGTAIVSSLNQTRVAGAAPAATSQSQLAAALLKNKLEPGALGVLKGMAKGAGADLVVFGTLFLTGKEMAFDSFVYSSAKDSSFRLAKTQFDPDLLNAGLELFKLAGEVGAKGVEAGQPVKVPAVVCADCAPPEAAPVNDARYLLAGEESEGAKDTGPRKPVTRKPVMRKQ